MKQIIGVTAESGIDHLPAMGSDVLPTTACDHAVDRPRKFDDPPRAAQCDLVEASPLVSTADHHLPATVSE